MNLDFLDLLTMPMQKSASFRAAADEAFAGTAELGTATTADALRRHLSACVAPLRIF